MENKVLGWAFALLCVLTLGQPASAQDEITTTETQVSRPVDTNMDDDAVIDVNDVDESTADVDDTPDIEEEVPDTQSAVTETTETTTTTTTSQPDGSGDVNVNVQNQPAPAAVAPPVATSTAKPPRSYESAIRLIPVVGASSFTIDDEVDWDNFDEGFTAGILADFGTADLVFETGVLALNANATEDANNDSVTLDVNSWGIPLLGKWNMSGHPHSTVFLKAGVMPFQPSGASDDFEVLGVAGIGAALPLFRNTALTLDATYNALFDNDGPLGNFQGVALMGGLQFGL